MSTIFEYVPRPAAEIDQLFEVIAKVFVPVDIDELDKPDKDRAPEVAVKFNAPVVKVKPFEAVNV